ncbi:MAG: hypothetical protein FD123_4364 [Bacteroidetes bacterium]|nr:MAG: hypothetical protein FD123_4364 [Bacteroidota bacterium]
MTYNPFFDTFFSSFWYTLGLMALLAVTGFIFRGPLFVNRKYKGWLGAFYFALTMLLLFLPLFINPNAWGFGPAIDIENIKADDRSAAVFDYILEAGGEGDDPTPMYRVHMIDLKTGEKKFRKLLGPSFELVALTKDAVVAERGNMELVFIDRNDGHELARMNRETLPGLYTELAPGIDQVNIDRYDMTMHVSVITGKHFTISMNDRSISPMTENARSIKDTAGPNLKAEDGSIRERKKYGEPVLLKLEGQSWNDKVKKLKSPDDSIINMQLEFLDGKFAGVNEKLQVAFILHYETTKNLHFLLSAVSLDGKKVLWQIKQKDLTVEEREIPALVCTAMAESLDGLLLSANGTVMLIDAATGKVSWVNSL